MAKIAIRVFLFLLLTVLTQLGELAYLLALGIAKAFRFEGMLVKLGFFLILYVGAAYAATALAPHFGRVPLSCFAKPADHLVVRSPLYCAFNRNYVNPELLQMAQALAKHVEIRFPGTVTIALDANFPFIDGFPLLPHLSHADGRKLDLAFYYRDGEGRFLNGVTRSPIGYFAFEQPAPTDEQPCAERHDWLTAGTLGPRVATISFPGLRS
jgi:hypothetical protein